MGKRVFTAIDIEEKEALKELEKIRNRLNLGFNPVKTEKMHITLEFFQNLDKDETNSLKNHLDNLKFKKFDLKIKNIGCFPSKDYIRVVWAGIESKDIYDLYNLASNHSLESDNQHDFHPHVTLFRVNKINRNRKKKLQKQIEEHENHFFHTLEVSKIKLFESNFEDGETVYNVLKEVNL